MVTARRGMDLGLVDQMGDFDSALQLAAELGNAKPRARWVRPRRSFGQKLFGRMSSDPSMAAITNQFQQLMTGGIYYLEPSLTAGTSWDRGD